MPEAEPSRPGSDLPTDKAGHVELIDSAEAFAACATVWNTIYCSDPDASVFLSHGWLSDLQRRRPGNICVLAWNDDDGQVCAFLPLRRRARSNRRKRRFDNVIGMAGNDWADHTGILCLPRHDGSAIPALGAALRALHWRRLDLEYLRMSPARLNLLMTAFPESEYRVRSLSMQGDDGDSSLAVSPVVHLPDTFEEWLQNRLSTSTRQRVRRFRRRLDSLADLQIRLSVPASRDRDLEAFRSLWLARWQALKGGGAQRKADTYRTMIADGLSTAHVRLILLGQGERIVAAHASYVDPVHRVLSFFVGARDPDFDALPPGLLLHAHEIEWAIEAGFQRYELLRGDEPYKFSLGAVDQTLTSLEVRPRELDPERVFLHPQCRQEALTTLEREQAKARAPTIDRLYGQLLESWPGDRVVLKHYEQWLRDRGDFGSADAIKRELE